MKTTFWYQGRQVMTCGPTNLKIGDIVNIRVEDHTFDRSRVKIKPEELIRDKFRIIELTHWLTKDFHYVHPEDQGDKPFDFKIKEDYTVEIELESCQ